MNRIVLLLLVALSTIDFAKVKREEFTITATVTAVKSHSEVTGMHTNAPLNTGNKPFDDAYNAAAGTNSTVRNDIVFVLVTEVGNRVYELESYMRLELGIYQAKRDPKGFYFLYTDKHGKPASTRLLRIVGEEKKK